MTDTNKIASVEIPAETATRPVNVETPAVDAAATSQANTAQANAGQGNGSGNGSGNAGLGGRGSCGGFWSREHKQCQWQGKNRWKVIGAVAAIALVGFMLGRGSAHHHQYHQGGHHGKSHMTESYSGAVQSPPLGMILDGIAATPEQRSKAVELFQGR